MSSRAFLVAVLCLGFAASQGLAQEEEVVLNKKRSEWLAILKTHKEPKLKRVALIALEVIGPKVKGVLDGLFEALEKEGDQEVRREIVLLLGRMGGDAKGAVEVLGDVLRKDKNDAVREAAALALGGKLAEFAHTQVFILAAALKDPYPGTREAAALALQALGEKAKPALDKITEVALDRKADRFPRLYAIQIVSRYGDSGAIPALVAIFEEESAHPTIRLAALEGLGRQGEKASEAVPALIKGLKEKDAEMRRVAAIALAKVGGPKLKDAWPAVQEAYKDKDSVIAVRYQMIRLAGAMAKDQREAVAFLIDAAKGDINQENRLAAIQELGQLEAVAKDAVPVLTDLAENDPRASVRDAAQAAVKKIKGG